QPHELLGLARQDVVAGVRDRGRGVARAGSAEVEPLAPVTAVPDPLAPDAYSVVEGGPGVGGHGAGLPLEVQLPVLVGRALVPVAAAGWGVSVGAAPRDPEVRRGGDHVL